MNPNAIWKSAAVGNYGAGRRAAISQITFHHIVGDAPAAIARFQTAGVEVSATYVIGSNGQLYQCVNEVNTPYTDGNSASNARSITIEHAGGHQNVPYTDAMYQTSTKLVADLIKRYGISRFERHRDVIDKTAYPGGTACPGTLDVERIVNGAKALQGGNKVLIENSDLWFVRMTQLVRDLQDRPLSREEFTKNMVGVDAWRITESLLDDPGANDARVDQATGDLANKDDWAGQIHALQKQVTDLQAQLSAGVNKQAVIDYLSKNLK